MPVWYSSLANTVSTPLTTAPLHSRSSTLAQPQYLARDMTRNDLPGENQQSPLILLHNFHPHFQMSQKSPYTSTLLHILQNPF